MRTRIGVYALLLKKQAPYHNDVLDESLNLYLTQYPTPQSSEASLFPIALTNLRRREYSTRGFILCPTL